MNKFISQCKLLLKNILPYCITKQFTIIKVPASKYSCSEPEVYNSRGNKKRTFYLADKVCLHSPYTFSSIDYGKTKFINWDRFNYQLPIHFYSHEEIFNLKNPGKKNFAILVESETIASDLYNKILENELVLSKFDGIFTHSERILNKFKNSYFIPGSSVWYGGTTGGGNLNEKQYLNKNKNISLVSSNKSQCELHNFRLRLAKLLYTYKGVDVLGTFNGGSYINFADSLENYRFSIVIENNITSCYFTEKLLNCFASMTIPIYLGATSIDKFFDADGIIYITQSMSDDEIISIIKNCNEELYSSKLEAVKKNYHLSKSYHCIEDYIYENYNYLFKN